jgi:hypothetical protein
LVADMHCPRLKRAGVSSPQWAPLVRTPAVSP